MLELRDIDAGYGDHPVLRGVSLHVPPRSVVALLGANGAGKTTTLRVASGLLRSTGGAVLLEGDDITGSPPEFVARQGVCHVPEGSGVFRNLTVRDNIIIQSNGRPIGEAVEMAVSAFPILGRKLDQPAGLLSGGQQQMLALVRPYICEPAYVLLDEVSLGLAPVVVDEIFAFLATLADAGCALLIVEQYIARALELADSVYLLSRGRVEFAGKPSELDGDRLAERYLGAMT